MWCTQTAKVMRASLSFAPRGSLKQLCFAPLLGSPTHVFFLFVCVLVLVWLVGAHYVDSGVSGSSAGGNVYCDGYSVYANLT